MLVLCSFVLRFGSVVCCIALSWVDVELWCMAVASVSRLVVLSCSGVLNGFALLYCLLCCVVGVLC